ncbi:MAG: alpha/beta fold hydrolase, partial [Acidimicrobiales bacterium]
AMGPRVLGAALRGAAQSDLPRPDDVRFVIVPTLVLAWAGDPGHPLSTAELLADLMLQAELHVARAFDDVLGWPGLVRRFLAGL